MKPLAAALAVLLLCASLVPPSVAANEPPLADAGLDQTVPRGSTVFLDAAASRDPDGRIDSYEWTIRTPGGNATSPDCPTCARTRFDPDEVGTYDVTVTVTDDQGATARDTLYVEVLPGEPPTITVAGPTDAQTGTSLSYTATLETGTAALETITWRVDGRITRVDTVTPAQRRHTLPYTFSAAGSHVLSATIEDVDGQRDTDTLTIEVEEPQPTDDGASDPPADGSGAPSGADEPVPSLADRLDPVVDGSTLVTGSGPFTKPYRLSVDQDAVDTVTWWRDGLGIGTGTTTTVTWSPGMHSLYAIVAYRDGSVETARFPDGTTEVEVDPEPRVELRDSSGFGGITGIVTATDEYDNLRSVSVSIDGTQVAAKSVDPLEILTGRSGDRLDLAFNYTDSRPGEEHRVVIRATDARGQVVEMAEIIEAVGIPEVISSKFVNSPVDSYHPRLDPERYTAKHVLKVKLNGVEPENIDVKFAGRKDEVLNLDVEQRLISQEEILQITSNWAGKTPNMYKFNIKIYYQNINSNNRLGILQGNFEVSPSSPEPRFDVISDLNPHDYRANGGLLVDMGRSFDPDGTDLRYAWTNGSKATTEDSRIGKVRDLGSVALRLADGNDEVTNVSAGEMLEYYSPPVRVTELTEGPYKQNETVVFELDSTSFTLSKESLHEFIPAAIRIGSDRGELLHWNCLIVGTVDENHIEEKGLNCEPKYHSKWHDSYQHFYRGEIAFEAASLTNENGPEVYIFNENRPYKSARRIEFPDVDVVEKGDRHVSDVELLSTSYLVEEPVVVEMETPFESVRDQYLAEGFEVENVQQSGTEYTLEKRVQVQEAVYETDELTFRSRGIRNTFLHQNPEWERGETESEIRRWTTTEREWRDYRGGRGEFTGSTRTVEVAPPKYRYERQYRYYYEVERTGTRTVRIPRTVRVPVTRYRSELVCYPYGCYVKHEPYTTWEVRTVNFTTTETYTYTVMESSTYWSTNKLNVDHEFTGRERRVTVRPAQYERQYLYEYEESHQEWVWYYTAKRTTLVQPALYEWQEYKTTKSEVVAQSAEMSPNRRVAGTSPAKMWFLTKQNGHDRSWTDVPRDPKDVIETKAAMNETLTQVYLHTETGEEVFDEQKSEVKIYKFNGYMSSSELVDLRLDEFADKESGV